MLLKNNIYENIKMSVIEMFISNDVKCIPINAFEIALKLGIVIIPYSALSKKKRNIAMKISVDGYSVETCDNKWIIYYNDYCKNYGRINQTIMHEIGHYILGHMITGEQEESEAKFFAKYALAPPPLIHNMKEDITISNIMEKFDISYTAASNAIIYYYKWLKTSNTYLDYEVRLLDQFSMQS